MGTRPAELLRRGMREAAQLVRTGPLYPYFRRVSGYRQQRELEQLVDSLAGQSGSEHHNWLKGELMTIGRRRRTLSSARGSLRVVGVGAR